jgi:hypothetical protein
MSPSPHITTSLAIEEAGAWLRAHNTGGNIMVSPEGNQVPSRMMLAYGDYGALQSFTLTQLAKPRDLPPSGTGPLEDTLYLMENPAGPRTPDLLEKHDVRYVVVFKRMPDRPTEGYERGFEAHPDLYETAFENGDILIVTRREGTTARGDDG